MSIYSSHLSGASIVVTFLNLLCLTYNAIHCVIINWIASSCIVLRNTFTTIFLYCPPPFWPLPFHRYKISRKRHKIDLLIQLNQKSSFRCALRWHHHHLLGGSHEQNPLCQKLEIHVNQLYTKVPGSIPPRNCCSGSPQLCWTDTWISYRSLGSSTELLWALHGLLKSLVLPGLHNLKHDNGVGKEPHVLFHVQDRAETWKAQYLDSLEYPMLSDYVIYEGCVMQPPPPPRPPPPPTKQFFFFFSVR